MADMVTPRYLVEFDRTRLECFGIVFTTQQTYLVRTENDIVESRKRIDKYWNILSFRTNRYI